MVQPSFALKKKQRKYQPKSFLTTPRLPQPLKFWCKQIGRINGWPYTLLYVGSWPYTLLFIVLGHGSMVNKIVEAGVGVSVVSRQI